MSEVSSSLCRFSIKRSTNNLPRLFYLSQEPSHYSRHWERARFQDNPSCITLMSSGLHLPARPRDSPILSAVGHGFSKHVFTRARRIALFAFTSHRRYVLNFFFFFFSYPMKKRGRIEWKLKARP